MENYCRYCGSPLNGHTEVCQSCGKVLTQKEKKIKVPSLTNNQTGTGSAGQSSNFYLIDFSRNMVKAGNIPILIYLILNILFITAFVASGMPDNPAGAVGISLLLYVISVSIALSPVGEFLVRYQCGCKRIQEPYIMSRLNPVFQRVYEKARIENPALPGNIKFYMNDDECPNAFATGRKTVCVTKGLLQLPDHQIEAILAHEFGHLAHHDTDLILVITVGNLFVNIIITLVRVVMNIMFFISALFVRSTAGALMHRFTAFCCTISVSLFMRIWSQIGVWLVMKSSRENEYQADLFACQMGYGEDLANGLELLDNGSAPKGVFAALSASHPPTVKRVQRMRAYCAADRDS